jgi:integrase
MASLYLRGNTFWISYRDKTGKWKDRSTGYRADNPGDRKQAERLCTAQSRQERLRKVTEPKAHGWEWVDSWIDSRWKGRTAALYVGHWERLRKWLVSANIAGPINLRRENCLAYVDWRCQKGVGRNTAIGELKLLSQVIDEAVRREYCSGNPCVKLGLRRDKAPEARAWTDSELATVDADLAARDRFGWMRATYLLGRYQAARLRSCSLPLSCIDLERGTIFYPSPKGGERRAFSQPIDKRLLPALREIVEHRKAEGKQTLCDLPDFPSLEWRRLLDGLGITDVSHHDLRRTWVTAACRAGIPEAAACRFTNHSSSEIHRIYLALTTDDMGGMLERLG